MSDIHSLMYTFTNNSDAFYARLSNPLWPMKGMSGSLGIEYWIWFGLQAPFDLFCLLGKTTKETNILKEHVNTIILYSYRTRYKWPTGNLFCGSSGCWHCTATVKWILLCFCFPYSQYVNGKRTVKDECMCKDIILCRSIFSNPLCSYLRVGHRV